MRTASDSLVTASTHAQFATRMLRVLILAAVGLMVLYAAALAVRNVITLSDLQRARFDGTAVQGQFEDYVAFYSAGRLVMDGRGSEIYNIEVLAATEHEIMGREVGGTGTLAFFNPPFVAVFYAPFALTSVSMAALLMLALNILLLLVAGGLLQSQLQIRRPLARAAFWLAVLSFESVFWLLGHNQLSMFLVLGFLGFYRLMRSDQPFLSGVALALLLVKPQVALLAVVLLVWKRQWLALAGFSSVAAILVFVSLAVSEPSVLLEYPKFLLNSASWEGSRGVDTQGMFGWNGFFSTVSIYRGTWHLILTSASTLMTIGLAAYAFRGRWDASSHRFPLAIGTLILASFLINPHVYLQDTVLLGLALALGFVGWRENARAKAIWSVVSVGAWVLVSVTLDLQPNLLTPLITGAFLMLAGAAMKQPSIETREWPRSVKYGFAEVSQTKDRLAS